MSKYPIRDATINVIIDYSNEEGISLDDEKRLMDALHSIKEIIPPDRWKVKEQHPPKSAEYILNKHIQWIFASKKDKQAFINAMIEFANQGRENEAEPNDAIEFAEWLENNRTNIDFREEHTHSISELHTIFKSESK